MVVAGIQTGCRLLFVGFFLVDVFEKYRTIYEKKKMLSYVGVYSFYPTA